MGLVPFLNMARKSGGRAVTCANTIEALLQVLIKRVPTLNQWLAVAPTLTLTVNESTPLHYVLFTKYKFVLLFVRL